jgi:hypothetical protein
VEAALRSVNLWNGRVGDKPAGAYSGGMKRRLSVAVSFMGDPLVVYLDEPSTVRMLAWCVQVYTCTPIHAHLFVAWQGMQRVAWAARLAHTKHSAATCRTNPVGP